MGFLLIIFIIINTQGGAFVNIFFQNDLVGIVYFIFSLMLIGYLIYLSVVDIKKRQLEYWQTGVLFVISVAHTILYAIAENNYLSLMGATNLPWYRYFLIHGSSGLLVFIIMLGFAMIKKNGVNVFGGADVWVLTAVSIVLGVFYIPYMLIIMCISYLLFAFIYKIITKKKANGFAFVPFITIGTILSLFISMI